MLENNNVKLRPINKNDIEKLNKWKNDYDVFKYLGGGFSPQSIDQHKLYIENLININDNNKRFIIEVKNNAIGQIGIYSINWINRNCELGIYIGEKDEWGKGYGKEACSILHNYVFDILGLNKIKLLVVEDNISAINMYKKLGYKLVGIYEKERFIEGEYKNLCIMELLNKS
ncbi:GNAT family N-acetyltransferase [Clostridium perfringens]|nr:acetyltransferase [Clostridium novyi]